MKRKIGIGAVALTVLALLAFSGYGIKNFFSASPVPVARPAAPATAVAPTPRAGGQPLYGWDDERTEGFDWGPPPQMPSVQLGQPSSQPTPPPSGSSIARIPLVGDLWQGISPIIRAIRWGLRNIWLILVLLFVGLLVLKFPLLVPLILAWKIIQTLWGNEKDSPVNPE